MGKKLYSTAELSAKYKLTKESVRRKIAKNNIKPDDIKCSKLGGWSYYLSTISNILDMSGRCGYCNKQFRKRDSRSKYCTRICAKTDTAKRKTDREHGRRKKIGYADGGLVDFPTGDRAYCTKKGKEERKAIMTCSVDCLIEELGDLE